MTAANYEQLPGGPAGARGRRRGRAPDRCGHAVDHAARDQRRAGGPGPARPARDRVRVPDDRDAGGTARRGVGRHSRRPRLHARVAGVPRPLRGADRARGAGLRPVRAEPRPSRPRRPSGWRCRSRCCPTPAWCWRERLRLPTFTAADGVVRYKRITLVLDQGTDRACLLPDLPAGPARRRGARLAAGPGGPDRGDHRFVHSQAGETHRIPRACPQEMRGYPQHGRLAAVR